MNRREGPVRIGVIPLALKGKALDAFRLLLLKVNTEQKSLEFSVLPKLMPQHEMWSSLQEENSPNREAVREMADAFVEEYLQAHAGLSERYRVPATQFDGLVILSMAAFTSNHYSAHRGRLRVIALGNWQSSMAPPSLLEFFLLLTLRYGIGFLDPRFQKGQHSDTRGCLFDYNPALDETRYKLLLGHVCDGCSKALAATDMLEPVGELRKLFQPTWLGKESDPSSLAALTRKLGYSLFITKGLAPTRWEAIRARFSREALGFVVQILSGVALAAILILIGLRGG